MLDVKSKIQSISSFLFKKHKTITAVVITGVACGVLSYVGTSYYDNSTLAKRTSIIENSYNKQLAKNAVSTQSVMDNLQSSYSSQLTQNTKSYLDALSSSTQSSSSNSSVSDSGTSSTDSDSQMQSAITVKLVGKKVEPKNDDIDRFNDFVELDCTYTNNTSKKISGFDGTLHVTDMFGNTIENIKWKDENSIAANGTITDSSHGVSINPFEDDDKELENTDFSAMKATYDVSQVVFADGTTLGSSD